MHIQIKEIFFKYLLEVNNDTFDCYHIIKIFVICCYYILSF